MHFSEHTGSSRLIHPLKGYNEKSQENYTQTTKKSNNQKVNLTKQKGIVKLLLAGRMSELSGKGYYNVHG